jgi:hypothetical protein
MKMKENKTCSIPDVVAVLAGDVMGSVLKIPAPAAPRPTIASNIRPKFAVINGGLTPFEARNKLVNIRLQCYKNA